MMWGFHKYKLEPWGGGHSPREDVLKIRHGSESCQNVSFLQGSRLKVSVDPKLTKVLKVPYLGILSVFKF